MDATMDGIPKFACDRMLARLARWLRLLGADTLWDRKLDSAAMLKRAREEGRVMITRDKRMRLAPGVVFLTENDIGDQLRAVISRVPFNVRQNALTRCSRCNAELVAVAREVLALRVPPFVYASNDHFSECPGCGRIYWRSTHPERIFKQIEALKV